MYHSIKNVYNIDVCIQFRPLDFDDSFIFHDLPATVPLFSINHTHRFRIGASIDVRLFTKGSGRTYNSLSGTANLHGQLF